MKLSEFKSKLVEQGNAFVWFQETRWQKEKLVEITPDNLKIGRKWITFYSDRYSLVSDDSKLIFRSERRVGAGCDYLVFWTREAHDTFRKRSSLEQSVETLARKRGYNWYRELSDETLSRIVKELSREQGGNQ